MSVCPPMWWPARLTPSPGINSVTAGPFGEPRQSKHANGQELGKHFRIIFLSLRLTQFFFACLLASYVVLPRSGFEMQSDPHRGHYEGKRQQSRTEHYAYCPGTGLPKHIKTRTHFKTLRKVIMKQAI
jgi:hypothetical protein